MNGPTVTVSAVQRGRRRKLHTFVRDTVTTDTGQWLAVATPTARRRITTPRSAQVAGHTPGSIPARRRVDEGEWLAVSAFYGVDFYRLPERVSLAPGVNPRADTLSVILDALADADRTEVDLGDVKTVLSEQGSRITAVLKFPDAEQRRHALDVLNPVIAQRCSTVIA